MFRIVFLLILLPILPTLQDPTSCTVPGSAGTSLGQIDGKCWAVTTKSYNGGLKSTCNILGTGYSPASIESLSENLEIAENLKINGVEAAYNGYIFQDPDWIWLNGDLGTFQNFREMPTPPPIPRSTLPPDQQRRSTAVVIGIDASLYSTHSTIFSQIDFAQSLSDYISARGPSEFAIFAYGCSQMNPWVFQYPNFVSTYSETLNMIQNVSDTILNDCVRSTPLDFQTMFHQLGVMYYNRQLYPPRPFKSEFLSMVIFSASTDSTNIQSTSTLFQIPDSSIITVNIGSKSSNIKRLSIPSTSNNWFQVTSSDDILGLVPKIDEAIFGPSGASGSAQVGASSSATNWAYLNSTDGFWYADGASSQKRPVLCQYLLPPAPIDLADPCFTSSTNFSHFPALQNKKCYQVSQEKKQFALAENDCMADRPIFSVPPVLTSILSEEEAQQGAGLLSKYDHEGMVWIGLRRSPKSQTWFFTNGDLYDPSVHQKMWSDGYPRDADSCDCVALVLDDQKWINTDCNKQLYALCAYNHA